MQGCLSTRTFENGGAVMCPLVYLSACLPACVRCSRRNEQRERGEQIIFWARTSTFLRRLRFGRGRWHRRLGVAIAGYHLCGRRDSLWYRCSRWWCVWRGGVPALFLHHMNAVWLWACMVASCLFVVLAWRLYFGNPFFSHRRTVVERREG